MIIIIMIISFLTVYLNEGISKPIFEIFNNPLFKFIIFCLISFIATNNPALGVILAIFVLTILQIITYNNLKSYEGFRQNTIKSNYEDYLNKPLLSLNKLDPTLNNLNLKVESLDDYYKNMIKKGRILVDDSNEINKDLEKIPDIREQQIANNTKRDGLNLIQSGLNRLQNADDGKYNNSNNNNNKFVKYDKIVENYINNPQIMSAFNELKYSFNKLQSSVLSKTEFDKQLNSVYNSEIQLLELIYNDKKNNLTSEKKTEINNILTNINKTKTDKNIIDKNPILLNYIKNFVEHLS